MRRFEPGEEIDLREVWDGKSWEIRRGVIVRDEADVVAVYTPGGSPALVATRPEGGARLRLPPPEWVLSQSVVPADRHFLAIHPTGANHSVLAIWDAGWRQLMWYINIESDLVRTETGFEYEDHFLDVIVRPDMSSWHWKDEDELEEALEGGLVTRQQAAEFRAEGERAVERLLARREPYDEQWEGWRPMAG